MKQRFSEKVKRTIVCIITAIALLTDAAPLGTLGELISPWFVAEISAADPWESIEKTRFPTTGQATFNKAAEASAYCHYFNTDPVFYNNHKNDNLVFLINDGSLDSSFEGIGTKEHVFGGTIGDTTQDEGQSLVLKTHRPIFNYVYDTVKIVGKENAHISLVLTRQRTTEDDVVIPATVGSGESVPLFAAHVIHNKETVGESSYGTWEIQLKDIEKDMETRAGGTYSGVIGVIEKGAKVHLKYTCNSTAAVENKAAPGEEADVGAIVGKMKAGSVLELEYSGKVPSAITSENGNAGGLVGTMEGNASLTINNALPELNASVTAKKYAGGLVGELTSDAMIEDNDFGAYITSNVTATDDEGGAGGLFGHYTNKINYPVENSDQAFPYNYAIDATVYAKYCGGVFGVLENRKEQSQKVDFVFSIPTSMNVYGVSKDTSVLGAKYKNDTLLAAANAVADRASGNNVYSVLPDANISALSGKGGGALAVSFDAVNKDNVSLQKDKNSDAYSVSPDTSVNGKDALNPSKINPSKALTLSAAPQSEAVGLVVSSGTGTDFDYTGYFGGIAGKYLTNDLKNSLVLSGVELTANSEDSFNAYGGAIGIVDGPAYVKANDVSINAKGTEEKAKGTYFGGLIGSTGDSCVVTDLGNFTLNTYTEKYRGGGVIGKLENGVLRLSGTTDMTVAPAFGNYTADSAEAVNEKNYGQLVGYNNNSLVYALGTGKDTSPNPFNSGWKFIRSTTASIADDLGTWGEVVRIPNIEDDILTFNSTDHTVTIKEPTTGITTQADFVKTALNMQLYGTYACRKFEKNTIVPLNSEITVSCDINLSGTGITGFTRDDGSQTFTGTLDGGGHTINLATGEVYGVSSNTEGKGQIYRHTHTGLFGAVSGAAIRNLTIDGAITVRNAGIDGIYVGGVAACVDGGTVEISNVTTLNDINYHEGTNAAGTETAGKNVGGLIGAVIGSNPTVNISGGKISTTFNLSGNHKNWSVVGSAIGKVTSDKFIINIGGENNTVTDSHTMTATGVTAGDNSDGGGLIGYIIKKGSYKERKVSIDHVDFSGAQIANTGSKNGGGFLGYAWLNATANINDVTVTSGTISGSQNTGAMVYEATGKWTVNELAVTSADLSGTGSSSLGLIVNKAYTTENNGTVNGGLYLNVMNRGYTLTDVNLPTNIPAVFDEIAAYTAPNVLKGGAAVVSINMNVQGDAKTKVTETGTYQNRLTATNKANPNARYYYNLDEMNKSGYTAKAGEKLLLWSLQHYYAYNGTNSISDEFSGGYEKTLVGGDAPAANADLTGLSYYPVYSVGNVTVKNLNIKFDYSGIVTTAENVFITTDNDNFTRDPAESNQHYLMHSGLFISEDANKTTGETTVTLNNLKLSGNFVTDGTHKGAIFSDLVQGTVSADGIELDGIIPKKKGTIEPENNSSSYLLINNIKRLDAPLTTAPKVYISNLKNTDNGYSEITLPIAESLIGTAEGSGLSIVFSGIKLDARNKANVLTDLNSVYHTSRSLFNSATLLQSIKTDAQSNLVYNYRNSEDWGTDGNGPRKVTYGWEVTNSVQYQDKENKYFPEESESQTIFTDPVTRNNASQAYVFTDNFLVL